MGKWIYVLAVGATMALAASLPIANAQGGPQAGYPIADKLAEKVIDHYQSASCEQIAAKKAQPPSPEEAQKKQRVVQLMRDDPNLRAYFLGKVAAPIANKLFECGMIP